MRSRAITGESQGNGLEENGVEELSGGKFNGGLEMDIGREEGEEETFFPGINI